MRGLKAPRHMAMMQKIVSESDKEESVSVIQVDNNKPCDIAGSKLL